MADNVIILAGGQGKRMKSDKPKALCKVLGEPMLEWVISACEDAGVKDICVVKGFMGEYIDEYLMLRKGRADIVTVEQRERLGTGHAVMQAADYLKDRNGGNTLVLCGDAPFIDKDTIVARVKKQYKDAVLIFITAPSAEELRNRLVGRGTESEEVINKRLKRAAEESADMDFYEYIVVNDNLDTCVSDVNSVIVANKCEKVYNTKLIEDIKKDLHNL